MWETTAITCYKRRRSVAAERSALPLRAARLAAQGNKVKSGNSCGA